MTLTVSQVALGKPEILHWPQLDHAERLRRHGIGQHTPISTLTVDEPTRVEFEWTIGEAIVDCGGELLVVWRWPFDWSDLQADDPASDGFMKAAFLPASNRNHSVQLSLRYNWIAGIEPWHHQLQVRVVSGELLTGDKVHLVCGDHASGNGSWRAPTCAARQCEFLMLIDHRGNGKRTRLVQQDGFRLEPGPVARLVASAESEVLTGEPVAILVRGEDDWGNPTTLPAAPHIVSASNRLSATDQTVEPAAYESEQNGIAWRLKTRLDRCGTVRFKIGCAGLADTITNPCVVRDGNPTFKLFWGDLHSGQTEIGCGCGTIAESYAFGRDYAGLKFITHQANDHYVTRDEWRETRRVTDEFYEPGRFVPLLGCEWSPLTKDGGDRNVFYRYDEPVLRRSDRFFREDVDDPEPDIPTAEDFHRAFASLDVLVNIHVGGRMTNLQWYDQRIERLCETHSTHGTVEWFFMDALSRGYRVGLTAGTDGVMGRPGADHPGRRLIRNLKNGLTAVYATELTREAIWDALENRRCYATTGDRIVLWFEINGEPMGSEIAAASSLDIRFKVEGTAAIERIDLFEGIDVIRSWQPAQCAGSKREDFIRLLWGGTERRGTARLQRVDWTGSLRSSQGSIELIETINFQSHDDSAAAADASRVQWRNKTAGNASGILVRASGDSATQLNFESEPIRFQIPLAEAQCEERFFEAGGVNRFVKIGPPPNPDGPAFFEQQIALELPAKTEPGRGRSKAATAEPVGFGKFIPYWLRVTQVDQAIAWSSPVYVAR